MSVAVRTKRVTPKPANPQLDPRFKNVRNKVGQKAAQLKKHPPAKLKANEAAKAAKGPPNQIKAAAREKQADLMKDAEAGKVQPDSFKALLLAEIEKVMPKKLDDADKFMEGGKEEQMKGSVSGKVNEQKGNAEKQIKTTAKAPPNTAGIKEKEEEKIPPDPATPTPTMNAAEGMPVPRTEAEVSQAQSKRDADQQFKDAQITTPQLKKAKDPRFTAVLDAKKEVETVADASPAKYRAKEKILLAQTSAKVQSDSRRGLTAFVSVKIKSGAAVKSRQLAAKAKDEKARKEVADNIERMYNTTKMKVERHLTAMEETVFSTFNNGAAQAIAQMKSNSKRDIDEFNDDRYSGISGKLQWLDDLFSDTPQGIIDIINRHLTLFKTVMNTLVERVAALVETHLKMAKDEIDNGQAEIKNYVSTLKDKTLQEVGKAAEKEVAGRFDEMRAGVEERKNAMAQKLAESYKAAIDKGNAIASELEAENAGAAYKLAKKIAEIAKLILDFKDKLVAILKKAVSVILDILSDPIGFFGNLLDALREGFSLFRKNFANNFKTAVAGWLLSSLGSVGFQLPKDLSPGSIVKLAMGIAGLTYERLRAKAAKLIGERNVALLEKASEFVKSLFTSSPDELWAKVKADLGNLQDNVLAEIKSWLVKSLVEAGIKKLLSMVVPGAGFVQAALAIYKLIVFLIERAKQIAQFISSVVDSVADIVKGNISAAAKRIEQALIQALSLIIDLLARLLSLGGIAETIKSIIKKVKDPVEKAINIVLAKIVQTFRKLFGKSTGKDKKDDKPDERTDKQKKADLHSAVSDAKKVMENEDATPSTVQDKLPAIQNKYKLTSLALIEDKNSYFHVKAKINPEEDSEKIELAKYDPLFTAYADITTMKLKPEFQVDEKIRDRFYKKRYRKEMRKKVLENAAATLVVKPPPDTPYPCQNTNAKGPKHKPFVTEEEATMDHFDMAVFEHWNNLGNNLTQKERGDWFDDPSVLRVFCESCNKSKNKGKFNFDVKLGFRGPKPRKKKT